MLYCLSTHLTLQNRLLSCGCSTKGSTLLSYCLHHHLLVAVQKQYKAALYFICDCSARGDTMLSYCLALTCSCSTRDGTVLLSFWMLACVKHYYTARPLTCGCSTTGSTMLPPCHQQAQSAPSCPSSWHLAASEEEHTYSSTET
jgi:hypothetical protein